MRAHPVISAVSISLILVSAVLHQLYFNIVLPTGDFRQIVGPNIVVFAAWATISATVWSLLASVGASQILNLRISLAYSALAAAISVFTTAVMFAIFRVYGTFVPFGWLTGKVQFSYTSLALHVGIYALAALFITIVTATRFKVPLLRLLAFAATTVITAGFMIG